MTSELDAFRSVDFDWTRQLKSVWRDPPYHVPSLHQKTIDEIIDYFAAKTRNPDPDNEPLGRVIVGPAGYGKTHLIGELRRCIWDRGGFFVLLDFIGIKDFWSSVALGFLNSLQVRMPDGGTQYDRLVLQLAAKLGISDELTGIAEARRQQEPQQMIADMVHVFTRSLARQHPDDTIRYRDMVTALILLISDDLDCHSIAHGWLQGMNLAPEDVRPLGFKGKNSAIQVVQGLSWVMSLVGPTLIAVDQIDAIVSASNSALRAATAARERAGGGAVDRRRDGRRADGPAREEAPRGDGGVLPGSDLEGASRIGRRWRSPPAIMRRRICVQCRTATLRRGLIAARLSARLRSERFCAALSDLAVRGKGVRKRSRIFAAPIAQGVRGPSPAMHRGRKVTEMHSFDSGPAMPLDRRRTMGGTR